MRLNSIPHSGGANRRRKRIGKGEGNGHGKTCGRGHKGQKSRSGFSQRPGFESGHIPLYRRIPKRGFNNKNFRTDYAVVNLVDLERHEADTVTPESLAAAGLIRNAERRVKVLGDGELSRALQVSAHRFSATAVAKIERAGGTATVIEALRPEAVTAEEAAAAEQEDDASPE